MYNDEYDDWYNSSVEEILYEDPDGIGDMIQAVCKLIHSCVDAGEYKEAFRTGRRLFMQEILTDDEYMTGPLEVEDFICCNELDIDLKKNCARYIVCMLSGEERSRTCRYYV